MRLRHTKRGAGRPPLSALLAGLPLVGCAVATIDVDVYKGPLSHHPDVQVDQMVSLATAAKPMLIELRDNLEWGAKAVRCREEAIRDGWYLAGFVPDPLLQCNDINRGLSAKETKAACSDVARRSDHVFKDPAARRVNIVLSLYDDVANGARGRRQAALSDAWEQLRSARERLDRSVNLDKKLAEQLLEVTNMSFEELGKRVEAQIKGRSTAQDYSVVVLARLMTLLDRNEMARRIRDLRQSRGMKCHRTLKAGEFASLPESIDEHDGPFGGFWVTRIAGLLIEDMRLARKNPTAHSVRGSMAGASKPTDPVVSTDEGFRLLLDADVRNGVLSAVKVVIDGDQNSTSWKRLSARVDARLLALAEAHRDAREAVEALYIAALEIFIAEDSTDSANDLRSLERLIAELTDPVGLYWLARVDATPGRLRQSLDEMISRWFDKSLLNKRARRWKGPPPEYWDYADYELARTGLKRALSFDPVSTSRTLFQAQSLIKALDANQTFHIAHTYQRVFPKDDLDYWNDVERRRHGMVLLPRFLPAEGSWTSIQDAYAQFQASRPIAQGFEEARSPFGIDHRIQLYLDAATRSDDVGSRQQADLVVRDLVQFANKILFLANNDELLNPPRPPAFVPQVTYVGLYHVFGGTLIEKWAAEWVPFLGKSFGALDEERRNYTSVLQAVGNSILVEADEYKKRRTFEDGESQDAESERRAILATSVGTRHQYLGVLVKGLLGESAGLEAELQQHQTSIEKQTALKTKAEAAKKAAERGQGQLAKLGVLGGKTKSDRVETINALSKLQGAVTDFTPLPTQLTTSTQEFITAIEELVAWEPAKGLSPASSKARRQEFTRLLMTAREKTKMLSESVTKSKLAGASLWTAPAPTDSGPDRLSRLSDAVEAQVGDGTNFPEELKTLKARSSEIKKLASDLSDLVTKSATAHGGLVKLLNDHQTLLTDGLPDELKPLATNDQLVSPPSDDTTLDEALTTFVVGIRSRKAPEESELAAMATARAALSEKAKGAAATLQSLDSLFDLVATTAKSKSAAVDSAKAAIGSAQAEIDKLTSRKNTTSAKRDDLAFAGKEAALYRTGLTDPPDATAAMVRGAIEDLVGHLLGPSMDGKAEAEKKRLKRAAELISARAPAVPVITEADLEGLSSPRELVDQMLGMLQHEHARAILAGGKDSEEARRITDAYKAVLARRASLMRLRPSSAFLRTSYPTTSLQNDPNLGWSNQLQNQGIRGIPLVGDVFSFLVPSRYPAEAIQAGIDKRFWQNINRVRVSGTGRSNYVIAKDDIGNWYVKAYAANPQKVLKSATNLGLLAMSPETGTDLVARRKAIAEGKSSKSNAANGTTIGRLASFHRKTYLEEALAVRDELATATKDEAWTDRLDDIVKAADLPDGADEDWMKAIDGAASAHLKTVQEALAKEVKLDDESEDNDEALPHALEGLKGLLAMGIDLDKDVESRVATYQAANTKAQSDYDAAKVKSDAATGTVTAGKALVENAKKEKDAAEAKLESDPDNAELKAALEKAVMGVKSAEASLKDAEAAAKIEVASAEAAKTLLDSTVAPLAAAKTARQRLAQRTLDVHKAATERLKKAADTYQIALNVVTEGTLDVADEDTDAAPSPIPGGGTTEASLELMKSN